MRPRRAHRDRHMGGHRRAGTGDARQRGRQDHGECRRPDSRVTSFIVSSNLLVVDLGNTNLVLGVYRGDELVSSWRLATARERTADEYGILARQLVGDLLHADLEGGIVDSRVP